MSRSERRTGRVRKSLTDLYGNEIIGAITGPDVAEGARGEHALDAAAHALVRRRLRRVRLIHQYHVVAHARELLHPPTSINDHSFP